MSNLNCEEILTDDEHSRLSALIEKVGEAKAAERLRICTNSVLRMLSRRPVRLGTISLARIALSRS